MLNLIIVHFFGLLTPGPDFFYVVRMAASNSHRNTALGILGISFGVAFWAAASMLGLSVLLAALPMLQGIIMMLGGSYLASLGILMAKSRTAAQFEPLSNAELNRQTTVKREIFKGLLVNLSNAKAIVYFASVMTLVLVNITELWQMGIALLIIIVETFVYFYGVSLVFSRNIAKQIYTKYSRYIDNAAGVVFLLFGAILIYQGIQHLHFN